MRIGRLLPLLTLAMLAGCAATGTRIGDADGQDSARQPAAAVRSVYVMRHLDRAEGPDPGLSPEGRRRAEALVGFFAADPPAAIYVSATRRARETAAPLAASLGITPIVYAPTETAALIAAVSRQPGNVLVVGHSNTVSDIVARLGGTAPPPLAETAFGDIWRISRTDGETIHQRLQ